MFHTHNSPPMCSPSFLAQMSLASWNAAYVAYKISPFRTSPHRKLQKIVSEGKWKLDCSQKSLNSTRSSKCQTQQFSHQHLSLCLPLSNKEMYANKCIACQNKIAKTAIIKLLYSLKDPWSKCSGVTFRPTCGIL